MTLLMTYAGPTEPASTGLRIGGIPLVPADFAWPTCTTCGGMQQFLAQVPLDASATRDAMVLAFQCANDPGLCDEWDPVAGGNAALVVRGDLHPAKVPATGVTALAAASRADLADEPGRYDEAREAWGERHGRRGVLGQLGGEPGWLQGDQTPTCTGCGAGMALAAQLEEGHDPATAANFGGGCAYLFACCGCARARFLSQC